MTLKRNWKRHFRGPGGIKSFTGVEVRITKSAEVILA
jgi:hypothetical protein